METMTAKDNVIIYKEEQGRIEENDMTTNLFEIPDTKAIQADVRALFKAMSPEFREHLMHSFLWSKDKFEDYLSREVKLEGETLKDAFSHLESLLARIESFADEQQQKHDFPSYDKWVDEEYKKYKTSAFEDHEDIERLMDEGGVVAPGKTSPVDTMENDSLAHYNHLKAEFEKNRKRCMEAIALMELPSYINLEMQAKRMSKAIIQELPK
jgi:hypothetical protein